MDGVRPGYQRTEVGVVPEKWTLTPLGSLLHFKNGVNADKSAYGRGSPFINVLEVITKSHLGQSDIPGSVLLPRMLRELYAVQSGDILFNRTSETQEDVGLAAVYTGGGGVVFGGFVIRGRPKSIQFDGQYAGFAFRAPVIRRQIIARGQGAVRANIGQAELSTVLVPLPPLAEQRAIAAALADVDGRLGALDRRLTKARDVKQAVMQQLLTGRTRLTGFTGDWTTCRLGEIGHTYGGLTGKSGSDFGAGSSRYITFLNVLNNVVTDPQQTEAVRVGAMERQNRVAAGDLLFNGSSETPPEVGLCSAVGSGLNGVYLNSFCFGFRFFDPRDSESVFLANLFRSRVGRDLMYSLAQGATRYNLSKTALLKLRLTLPPLAEQRAIAAVLTDIDAELRVLEAVRDKTRQVKRAMMHDLLTGRVRLV